VRWCFDRPIRRHLLQVASEGARILLPSTSPPPDNALSQPRFSLCGALIGRQQCRMLLLSSLAVKAQRIRQGGSRPVASAVRQET